MARDITEREQNRAARKISEARNAAVLESALDCIIMMDQFGAIMEWNPAAEQTFGFSRQTAVGRLLHELIIPPAFRERHVAGMRRYMETREGPILNRRIEVPALRADGKQILVELAITPIRVDGPPIFTAYLRDLTERRNSERALAESHALLRAVIESTEDAIFVKDLEGRYQLINPAGARFFGRTPSEMLGKVDEDFLGLEGSRSTVLSDQNVIATGVSQTYEDDNEVAGELRTFLSTKSPYRDAEGKLLGVVGLSRDITERKRNEKAIELAKNEAEQANRAKSEFLSRMSHELRTPLNAIIGFGQLLESDQLNSDQRESVGLIVTAGRHLLALINDVLDISRIEANRMDISVEPVSLNEIVQEAVSLVGPFASRFQVQLINEIPPDTDLFVLADRSPAKQILLNLLSNAIKYNRENGEVRVKARLVAQASGAERVCVEVVDRGIGLSPEAQARLFTPFDRLGAERTDVEGIGLGLVLTKRLVELMGATLRVESELGVGSTFSVSFPRAEKLAPTLEIEDETAAAPSPEGGRERLILYVEDNPSNLRLVERVLGRRKGLKLIVAMQGRVGLEMARQQCPDLILLDIHLPDIDGREVLRQLRAGEATRHIPVVVVSADATNEQIARLKNAGARAYLTKPIDVAQFNQTIDEMLQAMPA